MTGERPQKSWYPLVMLSKALTILFISYFSIGAHAIVGGETSVSAKGPDSLCRIVMSDTTGFGICSGNLVSSNRILTAAHCVEDLSKEAKIKVSCGYRGFEAKKLIPQKTKSGNTVFLTGVHFAEEAVGISYSIHPNWKKDGDSYDTAIIQLDRALPILPMKVLPKLPANKPLACWSAGYGISKGISMGFLQVGEMDPEQLQKNLFSFVELNFTSILTNPAEEDNLLTEVQTILRYSVKETMHGAVMVYGDSGGPVYCKNQDSDSFFQVGINRALYYSRVQRPKTLIFDISYTSAFSRADISYLEQLIPLRIR